MEGQSSKVGIDAIHCAYTSKTDLYPQLIAYIRSYTKCPKPNYAPRKSLINHLLCGLYAPSGISSRIPHGGKKVVLTDDQWESMFDEKKPENNENKKKKKAHFEAIKELHEHEYHQIREDVRHTNILFVQIFLLGTAVLGVLGIALSTADSNNVVLMRLIFILGLFNLIMMGIATFTINKARDKASEISKKYADIFDFVKSVDKFQHRSFWIGFGGVIFLICVWIGFFCYYSPEVF